MTHALERRGNAVLVGRIEPDREVAGGKRRGARGKCFGFGADRAVQATTHEQEEREKNDRADAERDDPGELCTSASRIEGRHLVGGK